MKKGVAALNYRSIFLTTLAGASLAFSESPYKPHAYQQNDWFSEYGDNTALYVNPASIAENDQIEVAVGLFQTISGKAGQEFISAVHPFAYNHSVGLSVFENGSAIDGSNAVYLENAYTLGYAMRGPFFFPNWLSNKLALGINVTLIQFNAFGAVKSFGIGSDVGIGYNPFSTSRFGHLQLGIALQNALQPEVKLPDDNPTALKGKYKIPRNLNTSLFWRGFNHRLELAGSVSVIDVTHDAAEGPGGNEIVPSVRTTYYLSPLLGIKAKFTKLGYPVVGATVNVKRVNLFRYLQLDLDMSHDKLSVKDEGRGFVWNFKAITRVGPTREERIGEARYRRLKIEPEDAYREAMRLYLARKFLLASYAFGKVITKYPSFHLVDQAAFYKGKSFENLRMHQAARDVYNDALKRYTDSDQRPKYMFQLMNIDYKEGKFDESTKRYQQIVNLYPESDVKSDADYVMGQMRYIQKDYHGAISLLSPILPGNANYIYARFTLGMSHVNLKKYKEAEAAFQDIMESKPSNSSEQEMKEVTAVKLGPHQLRQGTAPVGESRRILRLRIAFQLQVRRSPARSGLVLHQGVPPQGSRRIRQRHRDQDPQQPAGPGSASAARLLRLLRQGLRQVHQGIRQRHRPGREEGRGRRRNPAQEGREQFPTARNSRPYRRKPCCCPTSCLLPACSRSAISCAPSSRRSTRRSRTTSSSSAKWSKSRSSFRTRIASSRMLSSPRPP